MPPPGICFGNDVMPIALTESLASLDAPPRAFRRRAMISTNSSTAISTTMTAQMTMMRSVCERPPPLLRMFAGSSLVVVPSLAVSDSDVAVAIDDDEPSHAGLLGHASVSLSAKHVPPFVAARCIVRVRMRVPRPHVVVQADHADHADSRQSFDDVIVIVSLVVVVAIVVVVCLLLIIVNVDERCDIAVGGTGVGASVGGGGVGRGVGLSVAAGGSGVGAGVGCGVGAGVGCGVGA
jgi:hypothetical protein